MLNWRRDPGYEERKMLHESRMKHLKNEIEQLRRENAKQRALSALIRQHCFPDECNSTPLPPTEHGS